MFADLQARVIPGALYDLACELYPAAGPDAIRKLLDGLTEHDLRMASSIVLREGRDAARQFLARRPRRLRITIRR